MLQLTISEYFVFQQMNFTWRLSNAIMCLFFGLASYVQHNDELALFWITVYALPCLVSFFTALDFKKVIHSDIFHKLMYFLLTLYIIFSLYLFYKALSIVISSSEYNLLAFQEGKELFGVIIIQCWLLLSIYFINARIPFDALMTTTAKIVIIFLALSPLALWAYHGCFGQEPQTKENWILNI